MIDDILLYLTVFFASLIMTLVLTPIVREINRRFGMVDKPDPRRINKVPVPRGGGIAILFGVFVPYAVFHFLSGRPWLQGIPDEKSYALAALSALICLLGLADDKFSLRPQIKLLGQIAIAVLVWWWADLGFNDLWPQLPKWLDCLMTVFWIVGAVNAFNLIDGLDGLATGLALIATLGMAGSLFFAHNPQMTLFYFAIVGGLIGFLRYNYNPASVFLGDAGSMLIGFIVSTLPLASHVPHSLTVSVGVPILAMGVPIFDTTLAIVRRSIRRLLAAGDKSGEVMTADCDHLHHRILRATGLNQRKTAWMLYALAAAAVGVGLVSIVLQSRSAGLWMAAVAVAAVVIVRDSSVELFDAGRLLNRVARSRDRSVRRRFANIVTPLSLVFDILALASVYLVCAWSLRLEIDIRSFRFYMPVRVISIFVFMVFFRAYRTVWSRAMASNYFRLLLACVFGAVASSVFIYYWPSSQESSVKAMTLAYGGLSFMALLGLRTLRGLVRDLFYAVDCSRLRARKNVSRILVYGAGLRYQAFRREMVRTTSANDRMIVGLLDDDLLLKGKYIGGIQVFGTINDAPEVINAVNADAVVIACEISNDWLGVVRQILAPCGVKVTVFSLSEAPAWENSATGKDFQGNTQKKEVVS